MSKRTLEKHIKKVILKHYGEELWTFKEKAKNYDEVIDGFVDVLAKIIRGAYVECDGNCASTLNIKPSALEKDTMIRLAELRRSKKVSQEELAKRLKVDPNFVKASEEGSLLILAMTVFDSLQALGATREERIKVIGE